MSIIVNPVAGRRRSAYLQQILGHLDRMGCQTDVKETTGPADAERLASAIRPTDTDAIIAAGGDGTINEVLNGLTSDSPPLGLIPMGTANVLAAEIGLPVDAERLATCLATGPIHPIWAATLNGRRFFLMAGIGFDAAVVDSVDLDLKRRFGKLAYGAQALKMMRHYDFPNFQLDIDGVGHTASSAIIANGRLYAGRYLCAPRAKLANPSFEICLFERSGPASIISYGIALLAGRLPRHRHLKIVTGETVSITEPTGAPIQVDGDIGGQVPAIIRAGALRVDLIHPLNQAS